MSGQLTPLVIGWIFLLGVQCLPENSKATYLITVKTGSDNGAAPAKNDKVLLKLKGDKGETDFKELNRIEGLFDKDSVSNFSLTAMDIGKIRESTINKTSTGPDENWRLREIVVVDSKGTTYQFLCKCWISESQGLVKTLINPNVIPSTNIKTMKPTSATSSSVSLGASLPTSHPSIGENTAGPTNKEETTKGIPESTSTNSASQSKTPTKSTGSVPSGSSSTPTAQSTYGNTNPSFSTSGLTKASRLKSKPTLPSGKSETPLGSASTEPFVARSNPTTSTSPKRQVTASIGSSLTLPGRGKAKPSGASSAGPSTPITVKPSGLTSVKRTGASSTAPSGASSTDHSTPITVKPSVHTTVKPNGAVSTEPSGVSSTELSTPITVKPSGPTKGKMSGANSKTLSTLNTVKPSAPATATPNSSSSAEPPSASSTESATPSTVKPSAPISAKPHSVASTTEPSVVISTEPAINVKPSGASSKKPSILITVKHSGTTKANPSGGRNNHTSSTIGPVHTVFMHALLREINVMRLLHGVGPVLLEGNMSRAAQKEAAKLSKRGTVNDDSSTYGVSTCELGSTTPGVDAAKQCVSRWYTTVKDFDWPNPMVTAKTAEFARLIWKPTTHVGIGVSGNNVLVYFDPPSNNFESAKENISPVTDLTDGRSQVCREGYKLSGRSCFRFNPVPSTWEKAIENCARHEGTLASVQSQEENAFITGLLSGSQNTDTTEAWLGFNDRITESRYQWIDGGPVTFHRFLPKEPTGVGENCVAFKDSNSETGWEDRKCSDKLSSLCRHPAEGSITFKISFLIEAQNTAAKAGIPTESKDYATLIKEKINKERSGKPVEFVGESTNSGGVGDITYIVFARTQGSSPNFIQPLQEYLDTHDNHISPDRKDKVFIESITVNNPADGICDSKCFVTCNKQCNPICCSSSFVLNSPPAATSQIQASTYPQHTISYQSSSSYPSYYLPNYSYSYPSAQSIPYSEFNTVGCVRGCRRLPKGAFCPPYCPKQCCRERLLRRIYYK